MAARFHRARWVVALAAVVLIVAGCGDGYQSYKHDHLECKMAAHGTEVDVSVWRKHGVDAGAHAATFARVCAAARQALARGE